MPPKDAQRLISKDPGRSIRRSLKRVFGSNSISAPNFGDSSASSSTRQSSSPAASIASPNPVVDSSSIWANPTPTPRSALVQPVIEPGAPQGAKRLETTAWMVLEEALHGLSMATKAFPPLKSAASQLIDCLSVIQSAAEDRADYGDLASELSRMIDTLNSYANELSAEDQSGIIAYISQSIEVETARIKKKQDRSNAKRRLCAIQDRNDVMESYLKIQVSFRQLQSNANLWTFRKINKQLELNLLQGMAPEEDARYNSHYSTTVKRRGCTAETREKIHSDLRDWAQNPGDAKVYWMNGMAGTGKTTIAYTLCEWLEANKKLAANFFCSRTKDSCRDVGRIVPTIACQLARYSPAFRVALCKVLEQDQGASKLNVRQQLEKLLKDPLLAIDTAFPDGAVIVVDALDECDNTEGVRLLLTALTKLARVLPIKFFVSSRPEPAIYEKMQLSSDYSPSVLRLHDIEESIVKEDIQKFLTEAFGLMAIPPSHDQIERLARQSGKLFIYAATVVRFVIPSNAPGVNSSARLQMMLDVDPSGTSTAQPTSTRRYKQLDELYSLILKPTFNEELEEEETVAIRLILSTVVCAKEPLAAQTLARLLALNKIHILSALQSLRSVLHISEDQGLISVLHASFSDYLFDELRSGNYYCDKTKHNYLLATHCFALMEEELHFNICELQSSFIFDDDVTGLGKRIEANICAALFYACRYWGDHLSSTSSLGGALTPNLDKFLSLQLLFWMEVLNLKQCIVTGVSVLFKVQDWLRAEGGSANTKKRVADAQDFLTRFAASACTRSTPHIYISALPFCPKDSTVYAQYWGDTSDLLDVKGTAMNRRAQAAIATWAAGVEVLTAVFSQDGSQIALGSNDGTIRVWDARTGSDVLQPFKGHSLPINSVSFSPDGACVVSGCQDHTIKLWDARTGDRISGQFEGHTRSVNSISFSCDGDRIVSGSDDRTILVWDAQTGDAVVQPFTGHLGWVCSVAFSPDGDQIVSGSSDCTIRMWDAWTGDTIAGPFQGHTRSVHSVSFSPDGYRVVSGSADCTIRLWDAWTGEMIAQPTLSHRRPVNSVAFSPDGTYIASSSDDRTVQVWNTLIGDTVGLLEGHSDSVNSVAFSPDGARIVSSSRDRTLRLWNSWNSNGLTSADFVEGHTDSVNFVDFESDGSLINSASVDGVKRTWNAYTGDLVPRHYFRPRQINSYAFSPDGSLIASGTTNPTIRVCRAFTDQEVCEPLRGHAGVVHTVAFSPDGERLVSGSFDRTVRVWDISAGVVIAGPFEGHTDSVRSVAFSRDGTRVVSGSHDLTVRVWDVATGNTIAGPFQGHTGFINSVAFSPDGFRVISGSYDRTIRVWELQNRSSTDNWKFRHDGWLMRNDVPYLWVPLDLHSCFPLPSHPLAIGPQGSIHIDNWALALGRGWASYHRTKTD